MGGSEAEGRRRFFLAKRRRVTLTDGVVVVIRPATLSEAAEFYRAMPDTTTLAVLASEEKALGEKLEVSGGLGALDAATDRLLMAAVIDPRLHQEPIDSNGEGQLTPRDFLWNDRGALVSEILGASGFSKEAVDRLNKSDPLKRAGRGE